jgi:hypothetical protein
MFTTVDSVGIDSQPIANYNRLYLIYFLVFIIFFKLILLKVFTSIVLTYYVQFKE